MATLAGSGKKTVSSIYFFKNAIKILSLEKTSMFIFFTHSSAFLKSPTIHLMLCVCFKSTSQLHVEEKSLYCFTCINENHAWMIIPIYITTTEWGKTIIEVPIAMVPKFYHISNYDFDEEKKKTHNKILSVL